MLAQVPSEYLHTAQTAQQETAQQETMAKLKLASKQAVEQSCTGTTTTTTKEEWLLNLEAVLDLSPSVLLVLILASKVSF